LDTCNYYSESIGLPFVPQRVLLRRVFFLTLDKSKYVSVGFYPSSNYQPLVEFGGSHNKPIVITPESMERIASHLDNMCTSMCGNEHYAFRVGLFRLTATGSLKIARMYYDKHYLQFKLEDLQYLNKILFIILNQFKAYQDAQADVMTYVLSALGSATYVEPLPTANKSILYYQLYDELRETTL
jgi:hypothetical protein